MYEVTRLLNPLNSSPFNSQSIFPLSDDDSPFIQQVCATIFNHWEVSNFESTFRSLSHFIDISILKRTPSKCSSFRCNVSSLHFLMLPRFPEMKIQRLATNNLDALVFPENNTTQQLDQDRVGIALPPEVLKGKG